MKNITDIEEQFRGAMAEAGLIYHGPICADGRLHRIHIEGDSRGTRNGWFVLHANNVPAGAFGTWKGAITGTWRHKAEMSWENQAIHRDRVMAAMKAANLERARLNLDAALRAERVWDAAHIAEPSHPYLVAKQVGVHGIRQRDDHLVVPVRDVHGALMSLQRIGPDASKRFLAGGRVRGGLHRIGNPEAFQDDDAVIIFAEGYATGASIHEATGLPVFVAFNAGNLEPVAREVFQVHGRRRYIIAADNDHATEGNPGLTKAREAAKALGRAWVMAPPAEPGVSDWNDRVRRHGPGLLTKVLQ